MRIAQICSGVGVNGAVIHARLLCRQLAERGHRVTLICRPDTWLARQPHPAGVDVVQSTLHRWPADQLRRIANLVRERRIDVVHTHCSRANFFGVLLRWFCPVPVVATAHNRYLQPHWMFNDRVIAASDATRRFHCRYNRVPSGRIRVVHNFIEPRDAATHADGRSSARAEFGYADDQVVLGVVGYVERRKGLNYLVAALPDLLRSVPGARLLVVGTQQPEFTARVRQLAARLGVAASIDWAGHRQDVERLLAALDIYVLPSVEEQLPLSVLEAMSAGLPVVATRVGGLPECVVEGDTGCLVPARRPLPLARALIRVAGDATLRQRFGAAGRRRVQECFSADSQVPQIEAICRELTAARRAG